MKKGHIFKDGLIGIAIGAAALTPGVSASSICLIFGAFEKLTGATKTLFKQFWKSILIVLPFVVGAIIGILGLYLPFKLAFEHCLLAIVCLFGAFILGSIPTVSLNIKGEKVNALRIILAILGFILAASFGVMSVLFDLNKVITDLFTNHPWYLFVLVFLVGFIGSNGFVVPGLSGSLLLLVFGFYYPILALPNKIVAGENVLLNISLFGTFAIGFVAGFIVFGRIMNTLVTKHRVSTIYAVLGFLGGSLISVFINSMVFDYFGNGGDFLLDKILGPILFAVGLALSLTMFFYQRKNLKNQEVQNAEN